MPEASLSAIFLELEAGRNFKLGRIVEEIIYLDVSIVGLCLS
jgi:hypothetical protein